MRIDGEPHNAMTLPAVSQGLLHLRNKLQLQLGGHHEHKAIPAWLLPTWDSLLLWIGLGLIGGASLHWIVLGLAITVVDPLNCRQLRMHIKILYFCTNPGKIKLPVQITRLHLNIMYRTTQQPHSNGLEVFEVHAYKTFSCIVHQSQLKPMLLLVGRRNGRKEREMEGRRKGGEGERKGGREGSVTSWTSHSKLSLNHLLFQE